MGKGYHYWCVFDPAGYPRKETLDCLRRESYFKFLGIAPGHRSMGWRYWYNRGWRIEKIRIERVDY